MGEGFWDRSQGTDGKQNRTQSAGMRLIDSEVYHSVRTRSGGDAVVPTQSFHHGVFMSLRLATANESHWGAGGHDFSRAAAETHLQEALAAEGYPSALGYVQRLRG